MSRAFGGLGYGDQFASGLPPQIEAAFNEIGTMQRGRPESAMMRVHHVFGGGILNVLTEHGGDLTHRMTDDFPRNMAGYVAVKEKVDRLLSYLRRGYIGEGFKAAHEGNIRNNAEALGLIEAEYMKRVRKALAVYRAEHEKLPVYNRAQWVARGVAVALGAEDFHRARFLLEELEDHLASPADWVPWASEYVPLPDGSPEPYSPERL